MTGINEQFIGGDAARIYGEYSDIPERFQTSIRAGVNFFELRTEKPIFFDRQINGPFSVSCNGEFNTVRQKETFNVDWQTGERASLRFEVVHPRTGLAKAFLPDDPFWHNRIMICDNPGLQLIHAYHTREGMFPGSMLLEEINLLYQLITVQATEFTVYNAVGRMIGSFDTRTKAETDIKDNGYKNHEVRERIIRVKSPDVLQMINRWHTTTRSKFGWTDCQQFEAIKNEVLRQIKERRSKSQVFPVNQPQFSPEQLDAAIVAAIRRMPIEERKKLVEETSADQIQQNVFNGKSPTIIGIGELKELAKKHDVRITAKATRRSIIEKLRKKGVEIADEQAAEGQTQLMNQAPAPAEKPEEEIVR